jgi:hypothetical protein
MRNMSNFEVVIPHRVDAVTPYRSRPGRLFAAACTATAVIMCLSIMTLESSGNFKDTLLSAHWHRDYRDDLVLTGDWVLQPVNNNKIKQRLTKQLLLKVSHGYYGAACHSSATDSKFDFSQTSSSIQSQMSSDFYFVPF